MLLHFEGRLESTMPGQGPNPPDFEAVGMLRSPDVGDGGWLLCDSFPIEGFLRFRLDILTGRDFPKGRAVIIRVGRLDVIGDGQGYLMHFTIESRP